MTAFNETDARARIGEQLCTHFFSDDARRSPGFRELLAEQVERVIEIAKRAEGKPLESDDLNAIRADGVILQGLLALRLVSFKTVSRFSRRLARFYRALGSHRLMKGTATVGEVLTTDELNEIWERTA